jgi:ABC-type nitrate/sulfonate/bicarbonate transport system permease component
MLVIKDIYLPLTFPHILTSLLQSFGLGLKVLVMAEFISNASPSIGNEIIYYKNDLGEMSYVYAWSIILVLFVLIIDFIINILKKKTSF